MGFGNTFLARWARLYANQTRPEQTLEPAIAALGVPYRSQHPVFQAGAVLDFAFPAAKLAVEVDGPAHATVKGRAHDAERTARLARWGWRVVRCTNSEALADPAGVVARIVKPALVRKDPTPEGTEHAGTDFGVRRVRAERAVDGAALRGAPDRDEDRRRGRGDRGRRAQGAPGSGDPEPSVFVT